MAENKDNLTQADVEILIAVDKNSYGDVDANRLIELRQMGYIDMAGAAGRARYVLDVKGERFLAGRGITPE